MLKWSFVINAAINGNGVAFAAMNIPGWLRTEITKITIRGITQMTMIFWTNIWTSQLRKWQHWSVLLNWLTGSAEAQFGEKHRWFPEDVDVKTLSKGMFLPEKCLTEWGNMGKYLHILDPLPCNIRRDSRLHQPALCVKNSKPKARTLPFLTGQGGFWMINDKLGI